jgi:zinc protease
MRALEKMIVVLPLAVVLASCGGSKGAVNGDEKATGGGAGAGEGEKTTPVTAAPAAGQVAPHFAEGNGAWIESPIQGTPIVSVRLLFYTGSIDDPAGKEGLTALTARLMAEGGTKRQSYAEILRALYPMATEIETSVDKEQTVFGADVHTDHVAQLMPILAEMIREPRLPDSDFARIRDDMVNDIEKRLRATDDEELGKELLNLIMYAKHPYGHFDGGTVKGLKAITVEDVRAHASKMFGKKRLLIGIGGAVTAAAKETLKTALAGLPEGQPRVAAIPRVAKPSKHEVVIADKPGKATAISIGFPHDAFRGHPDFSELGLVQSYIGEHRQFHGILMNEMREKRGLNYGDYAYVEKFIQDGWSRNVATNIARRQQHFEIWIRPVDPKDAVFSIRLALYLFNRMVNEGVTEHDVTDTKQFLAGYTRLWNITPARRLGFALDDHFYGTSQYLDAYRRDLEKMTAADVNAAIKKHLVSPGLKIAIIGPDAEALKSKLVSGEKSEKAYDFGGKIDESILKMDAAVSTYPLNLTPEDVRVVKADELFVE